MRETSRTRQPGGSDQTRNRELATLLMRLAAFVATLITLGALALPWVTLDGAGTIISGIDAIVLLVSPMREYLYTVSPLQAAILTIGPALVGLLAVVTSYNYQRRRSIYWAPPATLAVAASIAYGATDLVDGIELGLMVVMAVSILLTLHQVAIRVQVALRRRMKMPKVYRTLAIVTGMGHYRWTER